MHFHVMTLFPDMISQGLSTSITGRALKKGQISLETVNIRDFSTDRHRRVDDYTYGGGAGMLMQAEPVWQCYRSVRDRIPADKKVRTIYVTPQGKVFDQKAAEELALSDHLIFLCGHYEGIDERVLEETVTDCYSIGDYVLTGGELPAMVMIDCISRLVPGVLGNETSAETESFQGSLLEYPQYSRPEIWHERQVPEVLLTGNKKQVDAWRLEKQVERTRERRPDLYREYERIQKVRKRLLQEKLLHIDMIQVLDRGRGEILFAGDHEILIRDVKTGLLYHSGDGKTGFLKSPELLSNDKISGLVLHQEAYAPEAVEKLALFQETAAGEAAEKLSLPKPGRYRNFVYTPREKLPVSGLYRPDGKAMPDGFFIRDEDGCLKGYCGEIRVGSACMGTDGSMAEVFVEENFRGRKYGRALLTALANTCLDQGFIPYGRIAEEDERSKDFVKNTGFYLSKSVVIIFSVKDGMFF